jgi:hypothetical protein
MQRIIVFMAPMLLCILALLLAMILRVVILQVNFDGFNALGFYDIVRWVAGAMGKRGVGAHLCAVLRAVLLQVALAAYLVAIIVTVVKCNNLLDRHVKTVENEKLKIAKQTTVAEDKEKAEYEQLTILMEAAVAKMRASPDYVRILGVVITASVLSNFLGAVATGIGSALAKVILA